MSDNPDWRTDEQRESWFRFVTWLLGYDPRQHDEEMHDER